ncbi:hypothetical protein niasHT_028002 [Heterodera trifolii]|uniref:BZIP domain-containing protein n=1 Tax=Heterodera trifolii TaxID=157864 RepID=A0ABD2KEH0_9BILA
MSRMEKICEDVNRNAALLNIFANSDSMLLNCSDLCSDNGCGAMSRAQMICEDVNYEAMANSDGGGGTDDEAYALMEFGGSLFCVPASIFATAVRVPLQSSVWPNQPANFTVGNPSSQPQQGDVSVGPRLPAVRHGVGGLRQWETVAEDAEGCCSTTSSPQPPTRPFVAECAASRGDLCGEEQQSVVIIAASDAISVSALPLIKPPPECLSSASSCVFSEWEKCAASEGAEFVWCAAAQGAPRLLPTSFGSSEGPPSSSLFLFSSSSLSPSSSSSLFPSSSSSLSPSSSSSLFPSSSLSPSSSSSLPPSSSSSLFPSSSSSLSPSSSSLFPSSASLSPSSSSLFPSSSSSLSPSSSSSSLFHSSSPPPTSASSSSSTSASFPHSSCSSFSLSSASTSSAASLSPLPWQLLIDQMIREVQTEIQAEKALRFDCPNFQMPRKRSFGSASPGFSSSASSAIDFPSNSSSSSSNASGSPRPFLCFSQNSLPQAKRAKKNSLISLSHEELAERKKEQNRAAAQRYRSRKSNVLEQERDEIWHLETDNAKMREEMAQIADQIAKLRTKLSLGR